MTGTPADPATDPTALCRALEARWHREIPISAAMGIGVVGFEPAARPADTVLTVRAALAPNVNVHGSAFAGSLFSAASLCGWGLVYLQLRRAGLEGSIVFVDGRIRCLKPVRGELLARCAWTDRAAAALAALPTDRRARIDLETRLTTEDALAATFQGEYAVRLTDAQ